MKFIVIVFAVMTAAHAQNQDSSQDSPGAAPLSPQRASMHFENETARARCKEGASSNDFVFLQGPFVDEAWHRLVQTCGLEFYTAKGGESLSDALKELTGSSTPWRYVWRLNPAVKNPWKLKGGQTLDLHAPEIDTDAPNYYVVPKAKCNNLKRIVVKLGKRTNLKALREQNPDVQPEACLPEGTKVKLKLNLEG